MGSISSSSQSPAYVLSEMEHFKFNTTEEYVKMRQLLRHLSGIN